uniref:FHA domain-containing protein n=1 Tax=Globisporangium ultimum (strain ATCC 200006 / CBS 805.95 / DAOM BR144) TaxID=431595 RepID=K3WPR4_GLOUD
MASEKYESEPEDDGALSYYSQDSDRESTSGPIVLSETVHSDSDAHNMLKSSEELPPSPREVSLESDERLQDNSLDGSDAGFGSKSSRTRVMRCGKCAGCTASDCMKCRHCLDMKKYGGPGLRKQSCKNRKCIIPKVVLLNQSKDDEFVDEKGNIVYPDYYDGADMLDGAELYHTGALDARTSMISVIQECEIFIDRHLVFTCDFCVARFSSKDLLDLHERVEHSLATIQVDALEREASRMFLHPIQQNCFINAQLRERKQIQRACPRAYVKLEGRDFQYFMMQPCIVLGRLSSWWLNFYQNLVLTNATGLGGGDVDCHIGNDTTIDSKHALIAWSSNKKSFTIECLSDRTPISVNGQKVSFESMPMTLESRNLVEVGSCAFYFLLPKAPSENKDQWSCRQPAQDQVGTLPRSELQAWLHATIRKRRASAASGDDSKLDHASDVAAIKKRCQERLAMSS